MARFLCPKCEKVVEPSRIVGYDLETDEVIREVIEDPGATYCLGKGGRVPNGEGLEYVALQHAACEMERLA